MPETSIPLRWYQYGAKPGTYDGETVGARCEGCRYRKTYRLNGRRSECAIARQKNGGRFAGEIVPSRAACWHFRPRSRR